MRLLKRMNDSTGISWWDENRSIANRAIDAYNLWILGETDVRTARVSIALAYAELQDETVDYSEHFNAMTGALLEAGQDITFYYGF